MTSKPIRSFRRRLALTTALAAGGVLGLATAAQSQVLPGGASIPGASPGTPTFKVDGVTTAPGALDTTGTQLDIGLGGHSAIINWNSFSVGQANTVNFNAENAGAANVAVLNRVTGAGASTIDGVLHSDPNVAVYLLNPNGITFGTHANVNVGALIASSLDITDADFLDGNGTLNFTSPSGATTGITINGGTIDTSGGAANGLGHLVLLGAFVTDNSGSQTAGADAAFVAGTDITMTAAAGSPLAFTIAQGTSVPGTITANGTIAGRNVTLALATQSGVVGALLAGGSVTATSASVTDRGIVLAAGADASGVTIQTGASNDTSGAADATLTGTVLATQTHFGDTANLEVHANRDISVQSSVGAADDIDLSPGGTISLDGASIVAGGSVALNGPVVVLGPASVEGTSGQVQFNGAIDGDGAASDDTLDVTAGTLAVFASTIGASTSLQSLTVQGPATIGSSVATVGAQSYDDVTLTSDTSFSSTGSGAIIFNGSLDGAHALIVDSGGATTFGGAVGSATSLTSLDVAATGGVAINGGAIKTTGSQTYHDAVSLGADTTLAGATPTFAAGITGNSHDLALNFSGPTTINATIAGVDDLSTGNGGTTTLSGTITTGGSQVYNDAVTLGATTTLGSTGGAAITLGSTVGGAQALTVNTSGTTTFGGAVNIASLTTNAGGSTAINAAGLTTSGNQNYGDAVTLGADTTLTGVNPSFAAGVTGNNHNLALNFSGPTTVDGSFTGIHTLSTGNGGTTTLSGAITTSGSQIYNDAVSLGALTTLASTGSGSIAFGNTLNGGFALEIDTAGPTSFAAAVGGATPLASLTTDAGGSTTINGGSIITSGGQSYGDAVTLGVDTTLTSNSNGAISLGSTVGGAHALTVDTGGTTTFGGAINIASLTTNAGGGTAINTASITTSGDQTYNDTVSLGADTTLTGVNGTFASTITGNGHDLALNFSGPTTINSTTFTGIRNLSTGNGGTTTLSGTITTSGNQTYNDAVTLAALTTLASTGSGAIAFTNTLNGAFALTVNTAGTTSFGSAVGGSNALASLTTDSGGTVQIGASVTTTGAQTYNDTALLSGNATLTSAGSGAIGFGSTLDGAFALAINTAGTTSFADAVGSSAALGSLTTNNAGTVQIGGGSVRTIGAQTYNDAASLTADTTLTSLGAGAIGFGSTVNGAFALVINTAGFTSFGGAVGGSTALTSLATDSGGSVQIGGGSIRTIGAQTYNDAMLLAADTTLTSTGTGAIALASSVDSDSTPRALGVVTANGGVTFSGLVGNSASLASLNVNAAGSILMTQAAQAGEMALRATGSATTAALSASDDIAIRAGGRVSTGALTSGTTGDAGIGVADALLATALPGSDIDIASTGGAGVDVGQTRANGTGSDVRLDGGAGGVGLTSRDLDLRSGSGGDIILAGNATGLDIALKSGRNITIGGGTGNLTALDDLVLRATSGTVSVGNLISGASPGAGAAGDALVLEDPVGTTPSSSDLTGGDIDITTSGGLTFGVATTTGANSDIRVRGAVGSSRPDFEMHAGEDIILTNDATTGRDVALEAGRDISVQNVTATDDVALVAGGTIIALTVSAGASAATDAAGAADTLAAAESPAVILTGVNNLYARGSAVNLTSANIVSGLGDVLLRATGGNVTVTGATQGRDVAVLANAGAINLGTVNARDDIALRASTTITSGALTSGATVNGQAAVDANGTADLALGAVDLSGHDIDGAAARINLASATANASSSPVTTSDVRLNGGASGVGPADPNLDLAVSAADGNILLTGPTAARDVALNAGLAVTTDTISARDDIVIRAGTTSTTGSLASGVTVGGQVPVDSGGSGAGDILFSGTLDRNSIDIRANQLVLADATAARGSMTLTALAGTLTASGDLVSYADLALSAQGNLTIVNASSTAGNASATSVAGGSNGATLHAFGNATESAAACACIQDVEAGFGAPADSSFGVPTPPAAPGPGNAITLATPGAGDAVSTGATVGKTTLTARRDAKAAAASGTLTVSAATAGRDIALSAPGFSVSVGNATAGDDIAIRAGTSLTVSGALTSGIATSSGNIAEAGDALAGTALPGNDIDVQAGSINIASASAQGTNSDLRLTALQGQLTLGTGSAGAAATLDKQNTTGELQAISLTAGNATIRSATNARLGTVTANAGSIDVRAGVDPAGAAVRDGAVTGLAGSSNGLDASHARAVLTATPGSVSVSGGGLIQLGAIAAGAGITVTAGTSSLSDRDGAIDISSAAAGGALQLTAYNDDPAKSAGIRLDIVNGSPLQTDTAAADSSAGTTAILTTTGLGDVVAGRNLTAGSNIAITSARDVQLAAAFTVTSTNGDIAITAGRDLKGLVDAALVNPGELRVGSVTGGGEVTIGGAGDVRLRSATSSAGNIGISAGGSTTGLALGAGADNGDAIGGAGRLVAGRDINVAAGSGTATLARLTSIAAGRDASVAGGTVAVGTATADRNLSLAAAGSALHLGTATVAGTTSISTATAGTLATPTAADVDILDSAHDFANLSASAANATIAVTAGQATPGTAPFGAAQFGSLTAGAGTSSTSGNQISVTADRLTIANATAANGGLTLTAREGQLYLGTGTAGTSATLTKQGAAAFAGNELRIRGGLTTGAASSGVGNASITSATAAQLSQVRAHGGSITVNATGDVTGFASPAPVPAGLVLNTLASGGDLTLTGAGDVRAAMLTSTGGNVGANAGGSFTGLGAAPANAGANLDADANVSVVAGPRAALGAVAARSGSISVSAGDISVDTATAGQNLALTAVNNLSLGTGSAGGTATLQAGGGTAIEAVALTSANDTLAPAYQFAKIAAGNSASVSAGRAAQIDSVTTGQNVTVDGQAATVRTATATSGALSLSASHGGLYLDTGSAGTTASLSKLDTDGDALTPAQAGLDELRVSHSLISGGNATIQSASSTRLASITSTGGSIAITAAREITGAGPSTNFGRAELQASADTGDISVTAGTLVQLDAATAGHNLTVASGDSSTALAGQIDVTTATARTGALQLSAYNGNIRLDTGTAGTSALAQTTGTQGDVTIATKLSAGGSATVLSAGSVAAPTIQSAGDSVSVDATGAVAIDTASAAKAVDIKGASVAVGTATASTQSLVMLARSGALTLGTGTAGTTAALTKQGATGDLTLTTSLNSGSTATITSATDASLPRVASSTGDVSVSAAGSATGGSLSAGGNASITAGPLAQFDTVLAGGNVTATAGLVLLGTATATSGALALTASSGQLTLGTGTAGTTASLTKTGSTGELQATTLSSGGDATIGSTTNARLGDVTSGGNLGVSAATDLTGVNPAGRANLAANGAHDVTANVGGAAQLGTVLAGRSASITAGSLDIVQATATAGSLTLAANTGQFTLGTGSAGAAATLTKTGATGELQATTLTSGGDATINSSTAARLGDVTSGGSLTLTAASDATGLGSSGRANLTANGAGHDVTVAAGNSALLGNVQAARNVGVTAASLDVTRGAATAGTLALTADSGQLTLGTGSAGTIATLIKTNGSGELQATTVTAGGNAAINSSAAARLGDVTSGAAIAVTAATDVTGVGSGSRANLTATGTDVTVTAGNAAQLGNVQAARNIGVTAASLDASKAVATSGSLALAADSGQFTLGTGSAGTTATLTKTGGGGELQATTLTAGGNTTINSSTAVRLGDVTSGGALAVTAATDLTGVSAAGGTGQTGSAASNISRANVTGANVTLAVGNAAQLGNLQAAGNAGVTAASLDISKATAASGSLALTASSGQLALGTGSAGTTVILTKTGSTGELQATALTAGGDTTIDSSTSARLGDVMSGGNLAVTAVTDVTGLDSSTRANLAASGAGHDATATAGNKALLGTVSAGRAVTVTAASIDASSATASGGALTLTANSGQLTLGTGSTGGTATLTKKGTTGDLQVTGSLTSAGNETIASDTKATLKAATASGQTMAIQSTDLDLGSISAATVAITDTGGALTLGDNVTAGSFALSKAEMNGITAGTLTIKAGTNGDKDVGIGDLALDMGSGTIALRVFTTGRIDVTGTFSASAASNGSRTIQLGGSTDNGTATDAPRASVIRVAATAAGGGRLYMAGSDGAAAATGANLDLRGAKIGVGEDQDFLASLGLVPGGTPLSVQDISANFIGNPNSTLYGARLVETIYTSKALVTANTLTVSYKDYGLFQNTAVGAGQPSGVTVNALGGSGVLSLNSSGQQGFSNGFALFGAINGQGSNQTALLGPTVVKLNNVDLSNTRINGCLVQSSGGGCLASSVAPINLNVFDTGQADILKVGDQLEISFDPIVGTNNEALFGGLSSIDSGSALEDCSASAGSPGCRGTGDDK